MASLLARPPDINGHLALPIFPLSTDSRSSSDGQIASSSRPQCAPARLRTHTPAFEAVPTRRLAAPAAFATAELAPLAAQASPGLPSRLPRSLAASRPGPCSNFAARAHPRARARPHTGFHRPAPRVSKQTTPGRRTAAPAHLGRRQAFLPSSKDTARAIPAPSTLFVSRSTLQPRRTERARIQRCAGGKGDGRRALGQG